jgi:pyridoxal phosphate enzyme (YggS family)
VSLESVRERVERALDRAGRRPEELTVVVVTKGKSVETIRSLLDQGQIDFGENRAQELAPKVGQLPAGIRWHFVGPLQTNKVRLVRGVVARLHSLDRPELAAAWLKGPGLPPPALLQVNIGREPQKQGVQPEQALDRADEFRAMGVILKGLMAIPPVAPSPELARPFFRQLADLGRRLADRWGTGIELSMGMSDDFEVAIEEGATFIRVGRAIFEGHGESSR